MADKIYIDRPPRIEPELPSGSYNIPNPPDTELDVGRLLQEAFLPMIPGINAYFEKVLVMTDKKALRQNRLGLLQRIAILAAGVADLSKLEGF